MITAVTLKKAVSTTMAKRYKYMISRTMSKRYKNVLFFEVDFSILHRIKKLEKLWKESNRLPQKVLHTLFFSFVRICHKLTYKRNFKLDMHVQFLGRKYGPIRTRGISFENLLTIKKKSYLKATCIFVLEMIEIFWDVHFISLILFCYKQRSLIVHKY